MNVDLSRFRVVLVNTSHPGNIGAVARAMKNMGLSQLVLVEPLDFPSPEAVARASGADDVLQQARVVGSLDEALAGCTLVLGASARLRSLGWPVLEPRAAARQMIALPGAAAAALVLGREHSGLSNAELGKCNYLVHIPANPEFSSLNIAAAAQVLLYELRMAALDLAATVVTAPPEPSPDQPLATADELAGLYAHLEATLIELEFLDPAAPRQLMQRLRRLFNRAALDQREVNILRGILTAAGAKAASGRSRAQRGSQAERKKN
jgi:tRNA (cytidine32/uridine32-2'-O)-methyltransferase